LEAVTKQARMEVLVRIPAPWKKLVAGQDIVKAKGRTVREVLQWLADVYPGLKEMLLNERAELRHFIIHVNNEDIRCIENLETPLNEGDQLSVLSIIPIMAGG
jgi:molybdopterin synthase sulfur carrier subunit